MSETNGKSISVPGWMVTALRMVASVVVACAIGYARLVTVEADLRDVIARNRALETKMEARGDVVATLDRRLNTAELKQSMGELAISATLKRIEDTVKEVQSDVKELQKRKAAPQ